MNVSFYDYCVEHHQTALLHQWSRERNAPLTPETVSYGSHQKAWWHCKKGHEWQARVKARIKGDGCPVCAGRALSPGENDLASVHPTLAAQWHPTKNGTLTPDALGAGTQRKVWWVCEKGHEWQAPVIVRARGAGCPVCAGKVVLPGVNDLASQFPDISAQWHPEKNGSARPDRISPYSNRKVWWRCSRGHDYQARVSARTAGGSSCPYCAGRKVLKGFNDLATVSPKLAAQWHPTLNGALTPEMVTAGSHRKVWWQCAEGHVWKAVIYSRTGGRKCGCPVCAGKVRQKTIK